jgi:ribosome assembly protein YihI (activator of Der GTPase)
MFAGIDRSFKRCLINSEREMSGSPLEQFFSDLRREVGEDQDALQKMLHDLDATEGLMRNTAAFISEKLARVKLLLEDPTGDQLARLEKLEAPRPGN